MSSNPRAGALAPPAVELMDKIKGRTARVGVVGLGGHRGGHRAGEFAHRPLACRVP